MIALVGYSGFVGSNIYKQAKKEIDCVYNSKNITEAYGTNPDLLIYAGLRAEKYLANHQPDQDMALVKQAMDNIIKINPKKLVLISTIDIFKQPKNVDEKTIVDTQGLSAYGYNRYQLELWVRNIYPDALIIRLPALFGINIKKNFIYDYLNYLPFMLKQAKMQELIVQDDTIVNYYTLQNNGFYQLNNLNQQEKAVLKTKFKKLGFSALNFTDSRSKFQFYNLERLWKDIQIALDNKLTLWHPATQPVSAQEIYQYLTKEDFNNILETTPADYDYQSVYADVFGGKDGYIQSKAQVLNDIRSFVENAEK